MWPARGTSLPATALPGDGSLRPASSRSTGRRSRSGRRTRSRRCWTQASSRRPCSRHLAPPLDPAFDEILSLHYPGGRRLVVNGRALDRRPWGSVETAPGAAAREAPLFAAAEPAREEQAACPAPV